MKLILRRLVVTLGLVAATVLLYRSVTPQYPIEQWLFLRYAVYWLVSITFVGACLSIGHVAVRVLLGHTLPLLEQLTVAFAVGVFVFELALFGAGLLGLYGPVLFVLLPALCLSIGAWPLARYLRRALRHARALGLDRPVLEPVVVLAVAYAVLCLVALYLPVMTPMNASFDSRWRHMMIAEQYAVFGGIRRFQEGWLFGASPQFTPLLYAWAFMAPAKLLFDQVELCAHLEYLIFVVLTLVGVPALVRKLVPRANPWLAWATRFAFPGVLLYDSNLSVGADHIGAVFAVPLFLLVLRAFRGMTPRIGVLLGALLAGAACAKETTALLLVPAPVLSVVLRFVLDLFARLRSRRAGWSALAGSLAAGVTTVALSAPHWLKNLLWYGDPLYPNLHADFIGRPSTPETIYAYEWGLRANLWAPTHDLAGVQEALTALFTFSFKPLAWGVFHRDVPVFGSLFTLLLLVLPFVRRASRTWWLVLWIHLSLFGWYWIHHEERHLQALVPWMAAVVAAIATLVWRQAGVPARAALMALIGLQVVWGADVYFYPTHTMAGAAPIKTVADLLAKAYEQKYDLRYRYQPDQLALRDALPKNAVLLVHERRDNLGIGREVITDYYGEQGAIDYARLRSPDRVYRRLRELGVTHLAWTSHRSQGYEPLAGDIAFYEFAHRYARTPQRIGQFLLAAMPKKAPKPPVGDHVVVISCGPDYPGGIYHLADLVVPRFGPAKVLFPAPRADASDEQKWLHDARAVALDTGCGKGPSPAMAAGFERVTGRATTWGRGHDLWLPRPPTPPPPSAPSPTSAPPPAPPPAKRPPPKHPRPR